MLAGLLVVLALGALFDQGPFRQKEVSRSELIARADQLCLEAHTAFVRLQQTPPQTAEQAAELTGGLVGIAEDELARIAELDVPAELEPQVEAYLRARERGIEALRAGRAAAEEDDASAYEQAQEDLQRSQAERSRLAREVGFYQCSRPLDELEVDAADSPQPGPSS
jgi:hypothetical protein